MGCLFNILLSIAVSARGDPVSLVGHRKSNVCFYFIFSKRWHLILIKPVHTQF